MDDIKTDNQDTKVDKIKRRFNNTWVGCTIAIVIAIVTGLNGWHDFYSNFLSNSSKEKVKRYQIRKLYFEENGETIKGIEILSPDYLHDIKENDNGEFVLKDTLSDRTIIKFRRKSDLIIKTLPAYHESSNYVVYME